MKEENEWKKELDKIRKENRGLLEEIKKENQKRTEYATRIIDHAEIVALSINEKIKILPLINKIFLDRLYHKEVPTAYLRAMWTNTKFYVEEFLESLPESE